MLSLINELAHIGVMVLVVSSMLEMGMNQPLQAVMAPLRHGSAILLALLVNFALAPLLTMMLVQWIPLQPAHAVGLLLLGVSAGAPFLPMLAKVAGGNVAYAVALMLLQMVGSIVFMPIAIPILAPGLEVDTLGIARPLFFYMLFPLAVGFGIANYRPAWRSSLQNLVRMIDTRPFIIVVLLLLVIANHTALRAAFGSYALGTYVLFVVLMVGTGYLVGGAEWPRRHVFALGAGQRNFSAAFVVAHKSLDEGEVNVMLIAAFMVGLVVLQVAATAFRKQGAHA